jgi:hypothetical protein
MNALQFEAVKIALKQDRNGFVLTLNIHPDEIPEEIMRDYVGSRYAVALVRIESDETATPIDNRVKKAGMLCRSKDFQQWVCSTQGLNEVSEPVATKFLYERCEIASRTELNGNAKAKQLFDEMVEEYERLQEPF